MPSYGEKQKPAGVDKSHLVVDAGKRKMKSATTTNRAGFSIDNCSYKGNAVFNANE